MHFDQFFGDEPGTDSAWGPDPNAVRMDLVRAVEKSPADGDDELETAESLALVARGQFTAYGTDGKYRINDAQSHELIRALKAVLRRHGLQFDPPWSDFPSFRRYWQAHEGRGSWQARRDMLADVFDPVFAALASKRDHALDNTLVTPVSPRTELGWPAVDDQIKQLRERFATATTTVDYKDVGNRCVGILETLSSIIFDPAKHWPVDEPPPPVDKVKRRVDAYLAVRLPGPGNAELRALVRKASDLSHSMKHSHNADRTSTGITADAVILVANMLRRLHQPT